MTVTAETINVFSDLCQAGAVCIGAYFAVDGLKAWQREMLGKRKAELAEEVLAGFYEIKDIFQAVRMPFASGGEGKTRPLFIQSKETEDEANFKNAIYTLVERLSKHNEKFAKLHSLRYRFLAYFGEEILEPFKIINEAHSRIVVSTSMLLRVYNRNEQGRPDLQKQRTRWEGDIGWWTDESEDEITSKIEEAVQKIEAMCKPLLIESKS